MALVKTFLQTLKSIFKQIDLLKTNDDSTMRQCLHIQQRLKALEKMADFFKKKEPEELSDDVKEALEKLNKVLLKAEELIDNILNGKTSDVKLEFDILNKSLNNAFVVLSGALHVQEEKERQRQEIRLAEQEKKQAKQEKELAEQREKLAEQVVMASKAILLIIFTIVLAMIVNKKIDLQEKQAEQERNQAEQERNQAEQERNQAEQEERLKIVTWIAVMGFFIIVLVICCMCMSVKKKNDDLQKKLAEQEDKLRKLEQKNCTVQ